MCQQAKSCSEQGNHEKALTILDQVLQTSENRVEAHTNRGLVLTYLGRLDEARESYRRAIELQPNHSEAYRWLTLIEIFKPDDDILANKGNEYLQGVRKYSGSVGRWNSYEKMLLPLVSALQSE